MRKLIVLEFMTLDGVVQAGGGRDEDPSGGFPYGGWQAPYADDVIGEVMQTQMHGPFDLLLGRKTFEIWEDYWPRHDDIWPEANAATKYVASRTRRDTAWQHTVFLDGDAAETVRALKDTPGADLHVFGSACLVQTLLRNDLVDEMWLKLYPLTLGCGKKLFAEGTMPFAFRLTESRVTPSGILVVHYRRDGAVMTGDLGGEP